MVRVARYVGGMSDDGYWNDVGPFLKEQGQKRRARNRSNSPKMLEGAGLAFETKNNGAHLIIRVGEVRFDLWPGTGLWVENGDHSKQRRGVRSLIRRARHVAQG